MTTYSISLDDVDLALLPTRTHNNEFLKKEHFQFQLLTREEEKDLPIYTNYTCHICAIEVPAPFSSEHVASVKHQANVRITSEASRRMRALITATPPPLSPGASERFCDSCTCVVGKDHEKTKEHRVSLTQDRMLCDLAKFYIGDEDLNDAKENDKKDKKQLNKDEDKATTKDVSKVVHNVAKVTNTSIDETGQKQNAFKTKEINNKPTNEQETLYGHCTDITNVDRNVATNIGVKETAQKQKATKEINNKSTAEQETLYGHCTDITNVDRNVATNIGVKETAQKQKATKEINNKSTAEQETLYGHCTDITNVDRNVATNIGVKETAQKQKATKEINNKSTAEQENLYGHCTEFVKFNVAMYIKILHKVTSSPKIDVRPIGNNFFIPVNNDRIIVSHDNFNGYSRKEGKVHCNLCDHTFDEAYEGVHKLSVAHVTSVMPVVDSHCIRKIHERWTHCILCNEIVWNSHVEQHKKTPRHIEEKRKATLPQLQVKFTNTTVKDQGSPQNVAQNIPGIKPKNITVPNQNFPQNTPKNIQDVKLKNVTELFPKFCRFPSVTLPATNNSIDAKVVPNNNVPQSAANKTPELGTNKVVPNENEQSIVSYVYLGSENDINYPYTEESISSVRCVICDCSVPMYFNNRKDHLNGNRHAINLKKQFPPIE